MSISQCIVKEENKYIKSSTFSIWSLWDIEIVKFIILGLNKLQTCSDSLENWNINKQILLCSKFVYALSLQNSKTFLVTLSNCDKREKKAKENFLNQKLRVHINSSRNPSDICIFCSYEHQAYVKSLKQVRQIYQIYRTSEKLWAYTICSSIKLSSFDLYDCGL
jgi:hypothetical protein